jgi:hypothetical protein
MVGSSATALLLKEEETRYITGTSAMRGHLMRGVPTRVGRKEQPMPHLARLPLHDQVLEQPSNSVLLF